MRWLTRSLSLLAVLGTSAVLHADNEKELPVLPPALTGNNASAQTPGVTAPEASGLSPTEMQDRATEMVAHANETYRASLQLKEHAKNEKDVIKLNCVNSKLLQIKAQLNIADSENLDLQAAISNKSDTRFDAYSRLRNTAEAVFTLGQETKACIGEAELLESGAGVTVSHPAFLEHPQPISPFSNTIEAPAYASPFI